MVLISAYPSALETAQVALVAQHGCALQSHAARYALADADCRGACRFPDVTIPHRADVRARALACAATSDWLLGLMLTAMLASVASAQQATNEVWPELDVYWTPAKHQRTMLELSGSVRAGGAEEGSRPSGSTRTTCSCPADTCARGYRFTFSTRDASYRESRIVAEVTARVASGATWRLVERSRVEFRWVNSEYSWRLRERLHLQRFFADADAVRPEAVRHRRGVLRLAVQHRSRDSAAASAWSSALEGRATSTSIWRARRTLAASRRG